MNRDRSAAGVWGIVAILMGYSFMSYVNRVSFSVAGGDIRESYGIDETTFGACISAFVLAYTICMLPGGWISDRIGGRWALAAMGFGTAAFGAATGLLGLIVPEYDAARMLLLLLIVRAVIGGLTAPLFPAAGRVVSRWVPFGKRARANALVTGMVGLGTALSYPLFGALSDSVGWPAGLMILGAITGLLAAIWTVIGRDSPGDQPVVRADPAEPQVGADWTGVLKNKSLWLLAVSYAAVGYVENLVFYWSDHYFKNVQEFGEHAGRLAAMVPPLCWGVCIPLGGWLCDWLMPKIGYRRCRAVVAIFGMLGCALSLGLATLVENDVAIVACFAVGLGFMGLTEAPAWATAIDLGGTRAATSAAIANTGGNAGGALSPTLTPWISAMLVSHHGFTQQEGWAWAIRFAAAICLGGALLWFWINAAERRE